MVKKKKKKKTFIITQQVKNVLQDVGANDSSPTTKERFPDQNFRGASQQVVNCSLKYRNTRLKFTHPTKHTGSRVAETK